MNTRLMFACWCIGLSLLVLYGVLNGPKKGDQEDTVEAILAIICLIVGLALTYWSQL